MEQLMKRIGYRSRLVNITYRITERPSQDGLSACCYESEFGSYLRIINSLLIIAFGAMRIPIVFTAYR